MLSVWLNKISMYNTTNEWHGRSNLDLSHQMLVGEELLEEFESLADIFAISQAHISV